MSQFQDGAFPFILEAIEKYFDRISRQDEFKIFKS
jgi:hypothetical protein